MKNKLLRTMSLCLLLAILAGSTIPGFAAAKPKIVNHLLWVGEEYVLIINNLPEDAKSFSVTSKNKAVVTVRCVDKNDPYGMRLKALKAGRSEVTVKYKSGGKTRKVSAVFTAKSYPNPFAWVKVNGKKIDLKKNKFSVIYKDYANSKVTISFKLSSGWKLDSCEGGYGPNDGDDFDSLTWKNGKAYKTRKGYWYNFAINLINKAGDDFHYVIAIRR